MYRTLGDVLRVQPVRERVLERVEDPCFRIRTFQKYPMCNHYL